MENESTYRVNCKTCSAFTFYTRSELEAEWDAGTTQYAYGRCRECRRQRVAQAVSRKVGKRACGDWCWEGTGLSCTCQCGGARHGGMWRVKP